MAGSDEGECGRSLSGVTSGERDVTSRPADDKRRTADEDGAARELLVETRSGSLPSYGLAAWIESRNFVHIASDAGVSELGGR